MGTAKPVSIERLYVFLAFYHFVILYTAKLIKTLRLQYLGTMRNDEGLLYGGARASEQSRNCTPRSELMHFKLLARRLQTMGKRRLHMEELVTMNRGTSTALALICELSTQIQMLHTQSYTGHLLRYQQQTGPFTLRMIMINGKPLKPYQL